jgi:hypothetical protein
MAIDFHHIKNIHGGNPEAVIELSKLILEKTIEIAVEEKSKFMIVPALFFSNSELSLMSYEPHSNQHEKEALVRHLRKFAKRKRAKVTAFIQEIWFECRKIDDMENYTSVSESPTKLDGVMCVVEAEGGFTVMTQATLIRSNDKVITGYKDIKSTNETVMNSIWILNKPTSH